MQQDKKENLRKDLLAALTKNGFGSDRIDEVMDIITEPPQPFRIVHFCEPKEDLQSKMNLERE